MRETMTVEDAINVVHVLGCELALDGNEDVQKLVAAATFLVSHVQEQGAERERDRAGRHGIGHREATAAEGHRLENGVDGGGRRDFLAGRGVHAGRPGGRRWGALPLPDVEGEAVREAAAGA